MTTVTDEVWAELDPAAVRLSRHRRRQIGFAVVVGLLLCVAYVLFVQSGAVEPELRATHYHLSYDTGAPGDHTYTLHITVHNDGWFEEDAVSVSSGEAGVDAALMPYPVRIPAGGSTTFDIRFRVRDCRTVSGSLDFLIQPRLTVQRWWGDRTATLTATSLDEGPGTGLLPHYNADGPAAYVCGTAHVR